MKHFSIILTLFCLLPLSGWELKVIPTLLVNVDDQARFMLPGRALQIKAVSKVEPGQPFNVHAVLISKKPLAKGGKFSGHVTLTSPDGKTVIPAESATMFELPDGARGIYLSHQQLKVTFDVPDKRGSYRFTLTVMDENNVAKSTSAKIELVDSITDFRMMDVKEFNRFLYTYYVNPQPERLLAALNAYLTEGIVEARQRGSKTATLPTLLCLARIFRNNPQFYDELAKMSGVDRPKDQYLAILFHNIGEPFLTQYRDKINPHILKQISRYKKELLNDDEKIDYPQEISLLWGEFFAYGKFSTVKRIADELRKRPELPEDELKQLAATRQKPDEEKTRLLLNYMIRVSANGSLTQYVAQGHRLVRFYLENIYAKKLYPDEQSGKLISGILKNAKSTKGNKK